MRQLGLGRSARATRVAAGWWLHVTAPRPHGNAVPDVLSGVSRLARPSCVRRARVNVCSAGLGVVLWLGCWAWVAAELVLQVWCVWSTWGVGVEHRGGLSLVCALIWVVMMHADMPGEAVAPVRVLVLLRQLLR